MNQMTVLGGRYTLERVIQRRRCGDLYWVGDEETNRLRVGYIIEHNPDLDPPTHPLTGDAWLRLSREQHTLLRPPLDLGVEDGRIITILPELGGVPMTQIVAVKPIPHRGDAGRILGSVADVIDHVLGLGLPAYPITPDDIWLEYTVPRNLFVPVMAWVGAMWLVDGAYDTARRGLVQTAESGATIVAGDPVFIAPEILLEPHHPTVPGPATAQFTLALIAAVMLTHRYPFGRPTTHDEMRVALHHAQPTLPTDGAYPLSAHEAAVLRQALSIEPTARFATATEFVDTLFEYN